MTKSKVGAEPKKQRIRHAVTKSEGIHEGIHRDEYGYYDSNYHCYCFAYGYFFHRGISLAVKLTPDYIRDNWDKEGWCGGLKGACMARIDRKRKIAVIKEGTEYACYIERGLPEGYTIYKTDEDIPIYDITEPKNKKILIKMYTKYLIKKYLETFYNEYKAMDSVLYHTIFPNTQLRIRLDKPNWIETSRGALVPLETAINIFNQLYVDYIISGKTEFQFKYNEFKIGSFCVSRASYVDKFTDINNYENPYENTYKYLGYKEWMFRIGCHILWFDDIKDFARYYNLQDKLSFPLDKTTAECMENHLIHLHSGKTIEAVGMTDI